ncbi:L-rhamnose-H+ transport protein [Thermoflavifilum aggregans]|uniref:L-rhamnose-H+ transport protein n=1 Tax=Thermoflavifilum aggregans TaxID=454188 RepID=A0A2M9CW06_9BACT|nr:L-rhamnose/proton symporter RhaT [Thermoflavifilum aggregans]PJJ76091.1 L-rhamnose-H+ transport protein [Thermoflavifilum aggregans]
MQVIYGVILHFIGGFASGSFYMPFKKVRKWAWENYWLIGGFFSWLIIPTLAAWLTVPHFGAIIRATSADTKFWTYLMGVLWGIGGLTYGLGVRYLGMSLGNSVILGLTSTFGALLPAVYYDFHPEDGKVKFTTLLHESWGQLVLAGVVVCLIGIYLCGKAGLMKEKDFKGHAPVDELSQDSKEEFSIGKGLIVAIISGVLSACFNYGIEAGYPMAKMAIEQGTDPLFQNNVIYIVLLWGGLTTNLIWCIILHIKNRSFGDYIDTKTPLANNYLFAALAGTTWFLQFFFYGMGESKLGNGASSWILHMAFIILTANMWGLVLKEWKGVQPRTLRTIIAGIAAIFISIMLVGYGNAIKP